MTGETDIMEVAQSMIAGLARLQPNHFLLRWNGTKIPRGAFVGDHEIGWTQHGILTGKNQDLGYYTRLEQFGGDDGTLHIMLISTDAETVTAPPGGEVVPVKLQNQSPPELASPVLPKP